VIGLEIDGRAGGFFKTPSRLLTAKLTHRGSSSFELGAPTLPYVRCTIVAIRRGSSCVSNFAADLRPGSSSK
jgi:hypothetical protein